MRGKSEMFGLVALLAFIFIIMGIHELSAQQQAIAVQWGESMDVPDMGFNARILRSHSEENCAQPIQEDFRYDWNSSQLRQDVRDLAPKILRFPGGTPSNYWNWYSETRQVIGEDGNMRDLDICEATLIGRSNSSSIGCEGDNLDMTAELYEEVVNKTTVTLQSYLTAVEYFRNQGLNVQELFVLNMMDPFYYLGSPHLEYVAAGASPEDIRDTIKNNIVSKVEKQLDKILLEKCFDCETNDDLLHFELGNEFYLQRYGKYFPRLDCFDMIDDSLCFNCFPDIDFYADICEEIVPMIRERFTNAKISLNGSRNILQIPWNQVIIDRFGQGDELQIDAVAYHFYPKTFSKDSLTYSRCTSTGSNYNVDKSLHYMQWNLDRLLWQKNLEAFNGTGIEVWITEFNIHDYSEQCDAAFTGWDSEDFIYDSADWIHALSVFTIMDRFLTYRSSMDDPWTNNAKGIDISKIAMHLFYGGAHEAALTEERQLTAAGMAISTMIELMNEADSIQRLLVAPAENIQLDTEMNWSTDIEEGEMLPLHHDLEFVDQTGALTNMLTLDSYGWMFKNGSDDKAFIVNLRDEALVMNVDGIKGFNGDTRYTIHHVAAEDLTSKIDNGWDTEFIETAEGQTGASTIEIPPYAIVILEDIPVQMPSGLSESHLDKFNIYPNPTTGILNIRLVDPSHDLTEASIMDLSGRIISNTSISNVTEFSLDMTDLARGSYLVRISNQDFDETVRVLLTR